LTHQFGGSAFLTTGAGNPVAAFANEMHANRHTIIGSGTRLSLLLMVITGACRLGSYRSRSRKNHLSERKGYRRAGDVGVPCLDGVESKCYTHRQLQLPLG
jgi:hypothetical protein